MVRKLTPEEFRERLQKLKQYQYTEESVLSPTKDKYYEKKERERKEERVKEFFTKKRDLRTGTVKEVILSRPKDKLYTAKEVEKIEKSYEKRKKLGKKRRKEWKRGGKIKYEKRIRAGAARLTSFLVPGVSLPKSSYSYQTRKGKVGRPRGPSGRYVIPGKGAVGVYKYRRWARQQLALERMERGRVPQEYEQPRQVPTRAVPQREIPQQPIERNDNILNAPNVARGELRNVGQRSALINVDDLNRPITNKGGDYYTEIDPVSGKQILRKRVREKWLS